ncbi:MAG: cytochrome c oxidase subunit 3 family protein [Calditrichia bacterium]
MSHTADIAAEKHFDPVGARIGMWLFLFTELLLFGGLFLLYAVYMNIHPEEFRYASSQLDQFVGAMNTIILLTSSLTMVLSVAALQRQNRKLAIIMLVVTFLLAAGFLVNKYFEWGYKISHGIYPNSEHMASMPSGEVLFYGLYYTMTGLHALHVIIGMVIMLFLLRFILQKKHVALKVDHLQMEKLAGQKIQLVNQDGVVLWNGEKVPDEAKGLEVVIEGVVSQEENDSLVVKFENAGLYWHLVDVIWIFLFPLFYLISM